jgi:capsular exopolysaccharide synthesis family protein
VQIREYLQILWRRKWIILLVLVVTVGVVAAGTWMMTPVYSASAVVRIAQVQDNSVGSYVSLQYAEKVMNTYEYLLTSRPYMEKVVQRLDLPISPGSLASSVSVEAVPSSELMKISVESTNPQVARDVANSLATALVEEGQQIYSGPGKTTREILREQMTVVESNLRDDRARLQQLIDDGQTTQGSTAVQDLTTRIRIQEQIYAMLLDEYDNARLREIMLANSISLVEPAVAPGSPSKPRRAINLAMAFMVGGLGGVGLAFLFESLDPRIHSADKLESVANVPVLGSVPRLGLLQRKKGDVALVDDGGGSPAGEAFRVLRSVVLANAQQQAPGTLLITSAEPGVGKSTVVANLAVAMAQAGRRVIVVDSDLRNPRLHRVFRLSNKMGLSNAILVPTSTHATLQQTKVQGLRVLTSGPLVRYPAELLGTSNMEKVVQDLAAKADVVIFDSPPLASAADAVALASLTDAVLVVAARSETTDKRVQSALRQLDKVGAKVLGTVFNKDKLNGFRYYRYHDGTSGATEE